jgi:hypothetical protein
MGDLALLELESESTIRKAQDVYLT